MGPPTAGDPHQGDRGRRQVKGFKGAIYGT
jgi:hypothetical protein